jgi:hypothetical protein
MPAPAEATPPEESPDPPKPDALAILREATACAPLTKQEILDAADTFDFAGQHIATTLIAHCAGRLDAVEAWHRLRTAHRKEVAGKYLGRQVMPALRKKNQPSEPVAADPEAEKVTQEAATYYHTLFGQVVELTDAYTQEYYAGQRPNADLIEALFDSTDGTPQQPAHPAVQAVENAFSVASEQRDALARANQFVRFIVVKSLQQGPVNG